jgi:ABC-type polar amino acid transport system ATPase subunit
MADGIIVEEAVPEDFFLRPQHSRAKQFLRQLLTPMQAD